MMWPIVLVGAVIVFGPSIVVGVALGLKFGPYYGLAGSVLLLIVIMAVVSNILFKLKDKGGGDGN
jgi:uncharacterized membrane protein